jgi:hypothetical protein
MTRLWEKEVRDHMTSIEHRLRLSSIRHYGKQVPPAPFGRILAIIPEAIRRSIGMRLVGRSTSSGRRAHWLEAASDIRFVDYYGDDDTILVFEAPVLGESARELFEQPDLFLPMPSPKDTGFDLLGDMLSEIARRNRDSDFFDSSLLGEVSRLKRVFDDSFEKASFWGNRYSEDCPATVDAELISAARELKDKTPRPQRVRISGILDMIRASTLGFALRLADGQEIRGVLLRGDASVLLRHFQKEVVVLGTAIFRPSGRPLRIDAEEIAEASESDAFFSKMLKPSRGKLDVKEVIRSQQHKRGLAGIMGQWPGDETDEQVRRALAELS